MKRITFKPKFKIGWREKLIAVFGILLVGVGLGYKGVKAINGFFAENELVFNKVVSIEFKKPVEIKQREKVKVVEKEIVLEYPDEIDTPLEEYVMQKFGSFYGLTALAVFKAESGLREDAIGINSNSTIDLGIAQINQVNWKIEGCSLKEIVVWKGNIDCAFILYDRADGMAGDGKGSFSPWVAWKTDKYLSKLE